MKTKIYIKPLTKQEINIEIKTGLRICTTCKKNKKLENFHERQGFATGRSRQCNACINKQRRLNHHRDPNLRTKRSKRARDYNLRMRYGITVEQYDEILKKQKGVCAICGQTNEIFNKRLAIDHCHKTNKIRGLLCDSCNNILGRAKDNIYLLLGCIEYLKKQQEAF